MTRRAPIDRVPSPLRRLFGRALHLYFRMSRGLTLGVRAAVLNEAGEVLLVRHTYTPGWHLPGGGVEPGETVAAAIGKELREEANIEIDGPVVLHGLFLSCETSQRDHVAVFIVRNFALSAPKQPNLEIAESGFFALSALPEDTTPGTRRRLAEITAGSPVDSRW
jgi:ADP-ribose pyrophosphatase YjhB (NUDIX family)